MTPWLDRRRCAVVAVLIAVGGCATTPASDPDPGTLAQAPLTGAKMSKLTAVEDEVRATIPKGAGDYAHAVALARLFKHGDITFDELKSAVLELKLPPHRLGDGYLMVTPPPPPPGVTFDPKMMPTDWVGNWGVVAQAYYLGELTKEQYDELHRTAHPDCKK